MVAKSVKWALASLIAVPPAAMALGLGDVRLLSTLNAPLNAEIEVIGATPEELASLKARIAPRETFARYGLDYPATLNEITLTPVHEQNGRELIRLRSTDAITDPFITLLVEVDWARGRLVREYTMLLDPPLYAPESQQANEPVAAPRTGGPREGAIARTEPSSPAPEPRARAEENTAPVAPAAAAGSAEGGGSRTVRPGDTLFAIANDYAGGSREQRRAWMLAIYRNNPAAFDHNMNILRAGAVLRIPDSSEVASISPAEARAEIRRQYAAWRSVSGGGESESEPGRLRLVPPAQAGAGGASTAGNAEATELRDRVRELEAQLQESRRLLEARNAELARLQARLSAEQGAPAGPSAGAPEAGEPPAAAAPAPEESPASTATPEEANAQPPVAAGDATATTPEETAAAAAPVPEAPTTKPAATKPVASTTAAETGGGTFFDTLKDYWWAIAALLVAVLAFFGLRAFRARRESEFDDSLSRLAASGAEQNRDRAGDTTPLRAAAAAPEDESFVVEESGPHERPRFEAEPLAANAPRHVAADETISSETAINLDQGDPLAEADFHMAYGLYDQAADLVRIAITREPERRDLKLKLLEVFFVWGNKEQFLQTARELAATRDEAAPGEWEKIVIMGRQLAPEDELFAGGAPVSGAGMGGVDLDLEGGQSRVDFDLFGEGGSPGEPAAVDLDIGSALGEKEPDRDSQTATDHNLALHEDEGLTADAGTGATREMTGTTREMTQSFGMDNSPTVASFGTELEAPTVEQPAFNPTVREKLETALKQSGAAEQTAELAIDDLGLDLSSLDTVDQPALAATQESPTLVAGLDEHSRRIMDEAERRGSAPELDATAIAATGSWNLNGEDLDATLPPHQVGPGNGDAAAETSRLAAVDEQELDFDFSRAESAAPVTNGSGQVDLDVGTATVPDAGFTATQKLSSEDLALPDLEPVTMSEVGTKLDLARAYMDMGDPEGARNILEEVLQEGSVAQKQEAQRLLESLPG